MVKLLNSDCDQTSPSPCIDFQPEFKISKMFIGLRTTHSLVTVVLVALVASVFAISPPVRAAVLLLEDVVFSAAPDALAAAVQRQMRLVRFFLTELEGLL